MIGVIKEKAKSLRTNIEGVIPKFFKFLKYILVAMLSAAIWCLYFIGAAADIVEHYLKFIRSEIMKGKKDVRVDNMGNKQ